MDGIAESPLVLDHVLEAIEFAAGASFDPTSPQLHQAPRGRRRRLASEALAHQHGERLFDRCVGAIGDLVELAAMKLIVQHSGKVFRDTVHASRPDRLHPGLLDRFEHRASLLAGWQQAPMDCVVVTCHPQRDRVGMAAHETSSSGWRAMARRHPVTARLNGSFGASLAGVLGLMFEDMSLTIRQLALYSVKSRAYVVAS